jgi:hypothetical protein
VGHIEVLRKMGYEVHEFTASHCRVEGVIDLFVGKHGGTWIDLRTNTKGKKPPDQFPFLVESRINKPAKLREGSKT